MKNKNFITFLGIFLLSCITYFFTASPSVYTGDSGEIATAIYTWGVSHPTGFPTYVVLAKLFSYLLPWFEFGFRLNIFSGLCGAAAASVAFLILRKLRINFWASLAAALSFAFSATLWAHSTLIASYPITVLIFSLEILFLLYFFETENYKFVYALAALGGLGAGTHLTFLLFGPFAVIFTVLKILRKEIKSLPFKKIIFALLVFLAVAATVYSYIPLRAATHQPMNWGDPDTKERFINYVTDHDWSDKIGNRSSESWGLMLKELAQIFLREFTWLGLVLILIGAFFAWKNQRIFFYAGISVIFFNILLLGNYGNNSDIIVLWRYFLPSYAIMAIFLGMALSSFASIIPKKANFLILILPAVIFAAHLGAVNRHNNFLVKNATRDIYNSLPEGAILITSGDTLVGTTIYEQVVLKNRPDIILVNDSLFTVPWYREAKKKELESRGKKYADNLSYLIKENPETKFFAVTNASNYLKMNYDFYPQGLVYNVLSKKQSADPEAIKERNKAFWNDYDFYFLKKNKDREYFSDEITGLYTGALNNLGAYLVNHNFIKEGMAYFEKSLEIRENKNALYNLANIYMELGDTQKALEYKARFDALK